MVFKVSWEVLLRSYLPSLSTKCQVFSKVLILAGINSNTSQTLVSLGIVQLTTFSAVFCHCLTNLRVSRYTCADVFSWRSVVLLCILLRCFSVWIPFHKYPVLKFIRLNFPDSCLFSSASHLRSARISLPHVAVIIILYLSRGWGKCVLSTLMSFFHRGYIKTLSEKTLWVKVKYGF